MAAPQAVEPESQSDLVQIAEGLYEAVYVSHEVSRCFGEGKLGIHFKIVTLGSAFELVVTAFYRVRILNKQGGFSCGRHSKLARDWRLMFRRGADRWDRIPMSALKNMVVKLMVRTVKKDFHQDDLDPLNQYSVVDQIVGRVMDI
jgi:hypothetical protein